MTVAAVQEREQRSARSEGPWLALPVAALAVLCVRYARLYQGNVVDDAMTSMQYAKQLAHGNGLVFNVGERVEGYSNFAWVVFMTPIYWLSERWGLPFVGLVTTCNIALACANLVLVHALATRLLGKRHPGAWLAVGLCLVDNSYAVWAVLGLEVHFLAFFMLLAAWLPELEGRHRHAWLGLCLLAVHLTRPDAGLFCAVLLGNQLAEGLVSLRRGEPHRGRAQLLGAAGAAGIWILGYGCYFYLRYRYYGLLFPNTYYLKLGGPIDAWARGLGYLRGFLNERAFAPLLALLAALALRRSLVRGLLVYNLLHAFYVVYVGGDFFAGHRFFVPELPQLALLAAVGVSELYSRGQRAPWNERLRRLLATPERLQGAVLVAGVGFLGAIYQRGLVLGPLKGEVLTWGDDLSRQTKLFRWLADHRPEGASIATCLIGHTGFYSSARVIDMCGVIDPVTARREVSNFGKGKAGHEKLASAEETLAKQPTFVADYVIPEDLWQRGYFLRADIPDDTYEGIWQRDPLLTSGTLLPETRVSFDTGAPEGWKASGSAFEHWPSKTRWSGQGQLLGTSGGFINTFHPSRGTAATGVLESAPFELVGDLLVFRLAGGKDADRLRVELVVDGAVTHSATGRHGDQLSRRQWEIGALRGKRAILRVVDDASDAWGYLALDEIIQWKK